MAVEGMTGTYTAPVVNGQSEFIWYYHPDHLGSAGFVTDQNGELYEHIEYFPFGETWVQEHSNTQRTPYLYTGKELDEETGLYYYGARYYDPRTSVWVSADPILGKYFPTGDQDNDQMLLGMGGVFNPLNIGLFTFSHLNPLRYFDPDGRATWPTRSNQIRTGGATGFNGYYGYSRIAASKPKFHSGVDILGKRGDSIYAFEGGRVIHAGETKKEGKMVTIAHTKVVDGKKVTYRSNYMHLDRIDVQEGDKVKEGQTIGAMGKTGNAGGTPTHLHFQIKIGNKKVDPGSQFTDDDRVEQFFRGVTAPGAHSRTIPETNYEKVRPISKNKEE